MIVLKYSELGSNLKNVCDLVINNCEIVTIQRRNSENLVMMSESEFNAWRETIYLMSNPHNASWLMESIAQGTLVDKPLVDSDE
ncbi:type II toxin-antitoxin system Phd/YefM family antitoxin [Vibrio sp. CK2-1]|uniref:type II toxin-antitoxin system Phd/YefM family antitoxin n=1 Tax=Vibrio sp. CK2-1 TaxID=2912249 RepID=UPI001F3C9ECF|nr:type II toxin-antitoxin system Phd/YefM family antitoxin [Vibrio sp. CK2-1]MCF7354642.1 type II toxin-antitoxin system Phd/YefM family antitoxin [Vibrio sp. CK2-1]